MAALIECIPNISEGRREDVVREIREAGSPTTVGGIDAGKPGLVCVKNDPVTRKPDTLLAVNAAGTRLYSANETDRVGKEKEGTVSSFAIDRKEGGLKLLNTVRSGGAGSRSARRRKGASRSRAYRSVTNSHL